MEQMLFTTGFWYAATTLSTATVFLAGAINGKFKISGFWSQLVAWVIGALLSVGAWYFNIITLGEPTWLALVCLSAVVGLSSNGIYDIPFMKELVEKLTGEKKQ